MHRIIRVLLVGGTPEFVRMIRGWLVDDSGFHFVLDECGSPSQAGIFLRERGVDVGLLTGFESWPVLLGSLKRLRAHLPGVPVVMLGSQHGEDMAIQAIQSGAQDYLVSSQLDRTLLVRTIRYAISRTRVEQELRQSNAELEQSRKRLVSALADVRRSNDQLRRTQQELIQAEKMRSMGTLASGIAHEVKNPLATIRLGLDFLSSRDFAKRGAESQAVEEMKEAVARAETVIRELLEYAADRGLEKSDIDLNILLEKAIWMLNQHFKSRQISVGRNYALDIPSVSLDPSKIEQVMVNLLMNASQASSQSGWIVVRTYSRRGESRPLVRGDRAAMDLRSGPVEVVVEIRDYGGGIDEELLPRIFDPFFTTKPTGVGTGLGLSVSRRIVELHHGRLEVQNHPEGGVVSRIVFRTDSKEVQDEKTHIDRG